MSRLSNEPSSDMPTRPRYEKPVLREAPLKKAVLNANGSNIDPTGNNCTCALFES